MPITLGFDVFVVAFVILVVVTIALGVRIVPQATPTRSSASGAIRARSGRGSG
jgi:hypothetical protein